MRYGPEGKPFVPPTCPAVRAGHIPDLEQADFKLQVHILPQPPITEVIGVFGDLDDDRPNMLKTGMVTAYSDLPWPQKAHQIAGLDDTPAEESSVSILNTESEMVERIRKLLCDRVANCRGVFDGECWALGTQAVREVIEGVEE